VEYFSLIQLISSKQNFRDIRLESFLGGFQSPSGPVVCMCVTSLNMAQMPFAVSKDDVSLIISNGRIPLHL
jgi:hypothetical protein